MSVPLSSWATEVFGKQASAVRVGLGQALRNIQANAQAAQEQADSRTNHAYGSARWQGQFERKWCTSTSTSLSVPPILSCPLAWTRPLGGGRRRERTCAPPRTAENADIGRPLYDSSEA